MNLTARPSLVLRLAHSFSATKRHRHDVLGDHENQRQRYHRGHDECDDHQAAGPRPPRARRARRPAPAPPPPRPSVRSVATARTPAAATRRAGHRGLAHGHRHRRDRRPAPPLRRAGHPVPSVRSAATASTPASQPTASSAKRLPPPPSVSCPSFCSSWATSSTNAARTARRAASGRLPTRAQRWTRRTNCEYHGRHVVAAPGNRTRRITSGTRIP
jgi:hypothetical protein